MKIRLHFYYKKSVNIISHELYIFINITMKKKPNKFKKFLKFLVFEKLEILKLF